MWNGKLKAITFSFDDGVVQDKKFIELLDKYGCKATFNINSELLGKVSEIRFDDEHCINHIKFQPDEIRDVYKNHEVAVHTLTHPFLDKISKEEVIRQVIQDKENLERLTGKKVVGMAYPNYHSKDRDIVSDIIEENTPIKYARTTHSTHSFELQDNLIVFNPTLSHLELDKMFELGEKFVNMKTDKPQLFYIWGHSYEFDSPYSSFEIFERFLQLISGKEDIFYCTNSEAFNLE